MKGKKLLLLVMIFSASTSSECFVFKKGNIVAGAGDDEIVKVLRRNLQPVESHATTKSSSERVWGMVRGGALVGAAYLGYTRADLLKNIFKGEMCASLARIPESIQDIVTHKYLWAGLAFYLTSRMLLPSQVFTLEHVMKNAEQYVLVCNQFLIATTAFNTLEELQHAIARDSANALWADKSLIAMKKGVEYLIAQGLMAQAQILLWSQEEVSVVLSTGSVVSNKVPEEIRQYDLATRRRVVDKVGLYKTNLEHNVRLINDRLAQEQAVNK